MNKYEVIIRDSEFNNPILLKAKVYVEASSFEEACKIAKNYIKNLQSIEVIKCKYQGMI